jgi:hypothetical protein
MLEMEMWCFLSSMDLILKNYLHELRLQRINQAEGHVEGRITLHERYTFPLNVIMF